MKPEILVTMTCSVCGKRFEVDCTNEENPHEMAAKAMLAAVNPKMFDVKCIGCSKSKNQEAEND